MYPTSHIIKFWFVNRDFCSCIRLGMEVCGPWLWRLLRSPHAHIFSQVFSKFIFVQLEISHLTQVTHSLYCPFFLSRFCSFSNLSHLTCNWSNSFLSCNISLLLKADENLIQLQDDEILITWNTMLSYWNFLLWTSENGFSSQKTQLHYYLICLSSSNWWTYIISCLHF